MSQKPPNTFEQSIDEKINLRKKYEDAINKITTAMASEFKDGYAEGRRDVLESEELKLVKSALENIARAIGRQMGSDIAIRDLPVRDLQKTLAALQKLMGDEK